MLPVSCPHEMPACCPHRKVAHAFAFLAICPHCPDALLYQKKKNNLPTRAREGSLGPLRNHAGNAGMRAAGVLA
jgi:hypothetical protein